MRVAAIDRREQREPIMSPPANFMMHPPVPIGKGFRYLIKIASPINCAGTGIIGRNKGLPGPPTT